MKLAYCFINSDRSSFMRIRRTFKVKTNSGTLCPKHRTDYCFFLSTARTAVSKWVVREPFSLIE